MRYAAQLSSSYWAALQGMDVAAGWSPDRGSAQHMRERLASNAPALVATGRLVQQRASLP